MAKYRVIAASVNIHAGVLGLEPHQARARLHRVMYLGGNRYDVVGVSFKRGEEFDYEGELPKHLVECVTSCPVPETNPNLDVHLLTDAAPDDGVAAELDPYREIGMDPHKPPPKRKKAARGEKPAA